VDILEHDYALILISRWSQLPLGVCANKVNILLQFNHLAIHQST